MTAYQRAYRACRRAGGTREEAAQAGRLAWAKTPEGLASQRSRSKTYEATHRDERNAKNRAWYHSPEGRAWHDAHREERSARGRARYEAHRIERAIYNAHVCAFDVAMAEAVLLTFSMLPRRDHQDFANSIMTNNLCKASTKLDHKLADVLGI